MENVLGATVPSPFKRSLFWPENIDSNKKKMKREKIPSTVTSKAWKEYHEKKESEKKKKQQEKEERAKQRIENKKLKEQLANDKKNKTRKTKTAKTKVKKRQNIQEELTSESDMEISYAESDISYDETGSDLENSPLSKTPSSKATILKKDKKLSIGSFVIIKYEGEYFPGKIESLRKNEFEISTMTLTTGNTFKWPNTPDKMFYGLMEIMEEIKEPICLNKRGFYRIPEMDKYLPNIYNL